MSSKNNRSDQEQFDIPKSGTLGLLALGYRGVVAWRKVRDENKHTDSPQKNNP